MKTTPSFSVFANSADITAQIRARLKHIRLTDETGITADTVEIALTDSDPAGPMPIPPMGAELEIHLGYKEDRVRRMGLFVCDEIELSGVPSSMIIRARAAPYEKSKAGKLDLQTQKTRSWENGVTIGQLLNRIAGEHRLIPSVSPSLASITLPHTDQVSESDMNFLHRLAKRYDAIAKPAGGRLVFVPRGDATTVSGAAMPRVTLTPRDGSDYRVSLASRESAGTVIAYYRDVKQAKRREVKVGEGEPVIRIRHAYRDAATATEAARAKLRNRARAERTMSYRFPGHPDILAESLVTLQGFRDGVDGAWLVTRAEHYIGPEGYSTTIEAEQPNSAVSRFAGGAAEDREHVATAVPATE